MRGLATFLLALTGVASDDLYRGSRLLLFGFPGVALAQAQADMAAWGRGAVEADLRPGGGVRVVAGDHVAHEHLEEAALGQCLPGVAWGRAIGYPAHHLVLPSGVQIGECFLEEEPGALLEPC